jgi:hypothetical protein
MRHPFAAAVALSLAAVPAPAQEKADGPSSLFLVYRCDPARRAAFRAHMAGAGVSDLERWKREGVFADYLALFSAYVNAGQPDMVVRLDFDRYVDTERWKAVERERPGGLSAEGLALCAPSAAYLADRAATGAAPARDPRRGAYLYIPYHFEDGVGKPEYRKYFDTYVRPQNEAWIAEKALAGWTLYLNQHPAGAPWDALLLYEYDGAQGLSRRDEVKQAARLKLRADPAWRAASDSKEKIRLEDQVVLMDPLVAPAAAR